MKLDLVNVECTRMTNLHRNKAAGKVYRSYLSKKHNSLLPKYISNQYLDFYPVICIFMCSQITLLQQKNMKLQITILAVALVTIIGPAASTNYTACGLAKALYDTCGFECDIADCKCTTPSPIDFN